MMYFVMLAINLLITFYLAKQSKQKREDITALGIDPSQQPLADETSNFQLVYGMNSLGGSNCTWYGDYSTFDIIEKVKTPGFLFGTTTEKVKTANGYRIGFALSLGYGEQRLYGLKCQDKYIFQNDVTGSFESDINLPDFFGKYTQEGGLSGKFRFRAGTSTQAVDTYLQTQVGEAIPNYYNEAYLLFENFYIGNSNKLEPIVAIVGGYPEVTFLNNSYIDIDKSCNPMNIVCDLLVNPLFGINLPDTVINTDSFYNCQETLFNEGFGLSFAKTDDALTSEIISDINRIVDGQHRFSRSDGRLEYKLNRQDYDINSLYELNIDTIITVQSYETNASAEAIVEYKVTWTDINDDFKQKIVTEQNDGKYSETRQPVSKAADYPAVTSEAIARMIAKRDSLPLSQQYRKMEISVTDIPDDLNFGDVVSVNFPRYFIKSMPMRITSIDFGDSSDTTITLKLTQDIFSRVKMTNNKPDGSWTPIDFTAKNVDLYLINAPYIFTPDTSLSTNRFNVITMAKTTSSAMTDYYLFDTADNQIGDASGFTPQTSLYASIGRYETTIVLNNDSSISGLFSDTDANLRRGSNLALITEGTKSEWVSFTTISSGILSGVKRGLLDSIPNNFTNAAQIRFIAYGSAITESVNYAYPSTASMKAQTITAKDRLSLSIATVKSIGITNRALLPYVASNLKINTKQFDDIISIGLTELVDLTWSFKTKQKTTIEYYTDVQTTNVDGVSHKVTFKNVTTGAIIKEETVLGSSYNFSDEASLNAGVLFSSLNVEVVAIKDGLNSLEKYSFRINRV